MKKLILIIAILITNSSKSQISFNWSSDDYYNSSIGNQGILKTIDDITIQIYHTNPNADLIVENGYIFTNYDNSSNEIIVKYSNRVNLKSTLLSSKDGSSIRAGIEHFREDGTFIVRQNISGVEEDYILLTNYNEIKKSEFDFEQNNWKIGEIILNSYILGVKETNPLSFSIYPNPTDNTLFISGNETPITVAIYNVLGKEVLSIKNTNNINVAALPSGVYIIRISDGVGQTNRKFIKN
jgi:hypothetical protein